MRAWIQDMLGQMKSKEQLQSVLYDLCRPYGEVVDTDIVCAPSEPARITCRIRMAGNPSATSIANWLGTSTPDSDMIVLEYDAPKGFQS